MVPRVKAVNHNPLVMLKPWTVATLTVACLLCVGNVFAQCNIDFDFGEEPFGVSPDPTVGESFNSGVLDEDYFDVLHILIPSTAAGIDSAYPPQLAVDSVIVMADMVNGSGEYSGIVFTDTTTMDNFHAADIGLEVVLNNDNASPNESTFLGGDQYCAAIQGVPTRAGVYRIAIGIEAWAFIAAPFSVPYVFDNFLLRVNCPLVDSVSVINYNSIEGTDGQLTVNLAAGIETDDITWFNELGGEVGTGDSISVNQSGLYTVLVNTDSCSSEVSGILVEDEGLDCNLAATVDVVPASEGMADGQATVFITGASGEVQVNWYDEFGLLLGTEPFIEYLLSGVYSVVVTDELGCTVEISDVDATTDVLVLESSDWDMYPNPASDVLALRNVQPGDTWSLLTLDGRTLNQGRGGAMTTIDVSGLSGGIYLVRVESANGPITQKSLVLQRQ